MTDVFEAAAHELNLLADNPPSAAITEAAKTLTYVLRRGAHLHFTGVGKSGIAAQKIAATFAAHGAPAHFLDPVAALHGDLGALTDADEVILVSVSGKTAELRELVRHLPHQPVVVGIYGKISGVDQIDCQHEIYSGTDSEEDEVTRFVPSLSFIVTCLVGDQLALEVAERLRLRGPRATHPGGELGRSQPWS